jgi:pyruvate dehydrogenase E1 component alpha subunit
MSTDDYLFYAHRGLGYVVARGMGWREIFGDIFGRTTGSTHGKGGGTIHFSDPALGIIGQGGTLGSCFPLGAGTALASQMRGDGRVTLVFFGEGAAARGTFHESALSAATWKLPVVWICENNGWALSAPFEAQNPTANVTDRASAYGVPGIIVDGQDAIAVREATSRAMARAREGLGPTLIEAKTSRVRGHFEGDQQTYRRPSEAEDSSPRDPLQLMADRLAPDLCKSIIAEAEREVAEALAEALTQPPAGEEVLGMGLWAGQ